MPMLLYKQYIAIKVTYLIVQAPLLPKIVLLKCTLYQIHFRETNVFRAVVAVSVATRVDCAARMLPVQQCGPAAQSHVRTHQIDDLYAKKVHHV